jgi:hypothetical protein
MPCFPTTPKSVLAHADTCHAGCVRWLRPVALALIGTLAFANASAVQAATINVSTGLDASDNLLLASGLPDAHWVATNPGGGAPAQAVYPDSPDWYGGWLPNGPNSLWVARDASTSANGTGTYSTTFNLNGFDLSTVSLTGGWALDDSGIIALNGNTIGALPAGAWGSLTPVTVAAGSPDFVSGLNTLSITITDSDFFLEAVRFEGSVQGTQSTPEPATLVSALLGGFGLAVVRRKSRTRA